MTFEIARNGDEAADKAAALGFPVVHKTERAGHLHKSEPDAMRLGLRDRAAVVDAFEGFGDRLGPGPALAQRQADQGLELVVGARRDPSFGPVAICGRGGVWIEALHGVSLRLAPFDAKEARTMSDELKGRDLLRGFRGGAALDMDAFARLVADLSQWFAAAEWLAELDINHVIADGAAFAVVDVRMRVAAAA